MSHIWIDSDMKLGEGVEIEIKDIHKSSKPIVKKMAFLDSPMTEEEVEEMFIEKLNYFHSLEKFLKDEGLI